MKEIQNKERRKLVECKKTNTKRTYLIDGMILRKKIVPYPYVMS